MTAVKTVLLPPLPEGAPLHIAVLAGRLLDLVRRAMPAEDLGGLRTSQIRLLSSVPRAGISVTELAALLGTTKQGCGQLVSALEATGHLATRAAERDRRLRVVVRTPAGDATVRSAERRIARLERQLAAQVGPERYEAFRQVLEELVAAPPG
jgi:DNA-binding MarR family transcriptional regulator